MIYESVDFCLAAQRSGSAPGRSAAGHLLEPSKDFRSLAALRSALELGYTHFDTVELYAGGHGEELLGRAIKDSGTARAICFHRIEGQARALAL